MEVWAQNGYCFLISPRFAPVPLRWLHFSSILAIDFPIYAKNKKTKTLRRALEYSQCLLKVLVRKGLPKYALGSSFHLYELEKQIQNTHPQPHIQFKGDVAAVSGGHRTTPLEISQTKRLC